MYYQVNGKKHAVGTGIGLAVSRQLVEAMGGTLEVDSEEGHGSCFTLELVVESLAEPAPEIELTTPALRILLVEDVELNITVATALLEKLGHSVVPARCGEEALALMQPEAFDLVLLDIQLPDMTGFEVADQLLERHGREALPPLVALTANLIRDKSTYLAHGMRDVIGKPLSVDNLKRVLHQLFLAPAAHEADPTAPEAAPALPAVAADAPVLEDILDLPFLTDYADMVGKPVLLGAVELFAQMMPDYLAELERQLEAHQQDGIVSEAHKIKSAVGAIGLRRLHQLAKQAQSPDLPEWSQQIQSWVAELRSVYPSDLQQLKAWLAS